VQKTAPTVVIDTNVFVAGMLWAGSAHQTLAAIARRQAFPVWTAPILIEYARQGRRLAEKLRSDRNVEAWINWFRRSGQMLTPAPFNSPVSRDLDDDKFLAAAVAGGARYLVTRDKDLLALGKPFGVQIIEDRAFLRRLKP
jgi:uncharacterized protein